MINSFNGVGKIAIKIARVIDFMSLLMFLLPLTAPPSPEQISKTKETLVELFKILTRILKLFKYYNSTYHICKRYDPKHGSEDTAKDTSVHRHYHRDR